MIRTFRHKGLERFFRTGSASGIQADHSARLRLQLTALHHAQGPSDLNAPGWRLHQLHGRLVGHYAISVNANWRLVFRFEDGDAMDVDYVDYH
jgi:proteic killer suppression protein